MAPGARPFGAGPTNYVPGNSGFNTARPSGGTAAYIPGANLAVAEAALYYSTARSPLSREELAIDWQYPVLAPKPVGDGNRSVARDKNQNLELEKAFRLLAEGDTRPLLVLRECNSCAGTDDALLTRKTDNEKTLLMSRWFRCIKLPPAVIEDGHPFHKLFEGKDPAHLFVARPDGSGRLDLKGDQSRTQLWKVMGKHLSAHYAQKPDSALKALVRILDEHDAVDLRLRELNTKIDLAIEKSGPDDKKVKKRMQERKDLLDERAELKAKAIAVSQLKPRPEPKKV